ncbi:hypothetical protein DL89DRAFT_67717 [Linderina pennispora]|uniref:beta-N-acetylhexosaminidase n=1 Tax=Linderina pennispora TaxID=61395 RepID=A0A1Y1VRE5_9FUNG|nr:uncharacterized protein DL89DRAFT_67717 [Linderina pennispora]ORX63753.1 hypothetical protein DL89DRAFT_67717 [Linderina pennispora]
MKITASAIGLLAAIPSVFGLWPIPTSHTEGKSNSQVWWVDIQVQGQSSPVVRDAVERYSNIINSESFLAPVDYKRGVLKTQGDFQGLVVSVESTDEALGLETDESYTLDVPVSGKASLKAKSPYGVVRGLETFSQLVSSNGNSKVVVNTPISIKDAPAFPHRGVLFDTSRNWYSVDAVKHTLDAMSYNKLNVLHWHIVDSQSWGIESKTYPELHQKGAYSDKQLYSYKDIKDIVQYAKNRGIRVIPEFDVPGHTYAVGLSHPEIMSCLDVQPGWDKYAAEPPSGQLNIAKDGSIEFAKNIFKEYAALFPDNVIHVGGDEVNMHCWETDPDVQKYLAANKNETVESLLLSWYGKLHNYVGKDLKKTAFTWEETLFHHPFDAPRTPSSRPGLTLPRSPTPSTVATAPSRPTTSRCTLTAATVPGCRTGTATRGATRSRPGCTSTTTMFWPTSPTRPSRSWCSALRSLSGPSRPMSTRSTRVPGPVLPLWPRPAGPERRTPAAMSAPLARLPRACTSSATAWLAVVSTPSPCSLCGALATRAGATCLEKMYCFSIRSLDNAIAPHLCTSFIQQNAALCPVLDTLQMYFSSHLVHQLPGGHGKCCYIAHPECSSSLTCWLASWMLSTSSTPAISISLASATIAASFI